MRHKSKCLWHQQIYWANSLPRISPQVMIHLRFPSVLIMQPTVHRLHLSAVKHLPLLCVSEESASDQLHFADLQSANQTLHGSRTGTPEQVPSGGCRHQDSLGGSHHPRHRTKDSSSKVGGYLQIDRRTPGCRGRYTEYEDSP